MVQIKGHERILFTLSTFTKDVFSILNASSVCYFDRLMLLKSLLEPFDWCFAMRYQEFITFLKMSIAKEAPISTQRTGMRTGQDQVIRVVEIAFGLNGF